MKAALIAALGLASAAAQLEDDFKDTVRNPVTGVNLSALGEDHHTAVGKAGSSKVHLHNPFPHHSRSWSVGEPMLLWICIAPAADMQDEDFENQGLSVTNPEDLERFQMMCGGEAGLETIVFAGTRDEPKDPASLSVAIDFFPEIPKRELGDQVMGEPNMHFPIEYADESKELVILRWVTLSPKDDEDQMLKEVAKGLKATEGLVWVNIDYRDAELVRHNVDICKLGWDITGLRG